MSKEKERPAYPPPTPKQLNERAKQFWAEKTTMINQRISKYPEDVEFAVKSTRRAE